MTVVIQEMDVVAPEPEPGPGAPREVREQLSRTETEQLVEQVVRTNRARAQRLRAY
jgi:hypothetical protein